MKIYIELKAETILEKNFEGQKSYQVQTVQKSEKKGFEVVKVKITDEFISFKENDTIKVPVTISAMNSQIFYKQSGKIEVINAIKG